MDLKKEIQELKDRLDSLERRVGKRPHGGSNGGSKGLNFGFLIIIVVYLLLVLIGVIQFVNAG